MTRGRVVCLVGLFLLGLVLVAGSAGGAADGGTAGFLQPQTTPDEFDTTVFRVELYDNRSARWTIVHSRPLANQSEVDAFEAFAADFEANETYLFRNFRSRARDLVGYGENVTGRSMTATDFSRRAGTRQLPGQPGYVEMSFRWTNFARAEDGRVVVDDVFQGGMYVPPDQRLEFHRGPSVAFVKVLPQPDSQGTQGNLTATPSITWFGEEQFADRRPYVAVAPRDTLPGRTDGSVGTDSGAPATASLTDNASATPAVAGDGSDSGQQLAVLFAGIILLLVAGLGLAWYSGVLPPLTEGGGAAESGTAGDAASVGVPEEELLSDEDRVERLLQANGGRMKQVSIVEETEWSKSKVSMLLSEMEDDGQISKLRVGRENIISLAGQEPEAAGSPFDDE